MATSREPTTTTAIFRPTISGTGHFQITRWHLTCWYRASVRFESRPVAVRALRMWRSSSATWSMTAEVKNERSVHRRTIRGATHDGVNPDLLTCHAQVIGTDQVL